MKRDTIRHYDIHEALGKGAYGTVYRALDTRLMRPVVLKVLRPSGSADDVRERTLAEARVASAIEHPNVCAIYEAGEHEGLPYIVMQYVRGETLRHLLASGALPLRLALSVGIQVADGLAAAHHLDILHRDLKPENIMVTGDGVAKILDFGLARRRPPATDGERRDSENGRQGGETRETGETGEGVDVGVPGGEASSGRFGTTAYMAPEQFTERRSSEQSDVFALGVILYEMATGRHPFRTANTDPLQLPGAIRTAVPARPSVVRRHLPEALDAILLKALAKRPAQRYRHARDLSDALKAVMRSLDLETGRLPGERSAILPSPPAGRPPRRSGLSGLVDRVLPGREPSLERAIAVLPFRFPDNLGDDRLYGFALSNAVASRLARVPDLLVRPLSAFLSVSAPPLDPPRVGRALRADRVLSGSLDRQGDRLVVHWHLIEVETSALRAGGTIHLPAPDLPSAQEEVADQIVAALRAAGELPTPARTTPAVGPGDLSEVVHQEYLSARALLAGFTLRAGTRDDLDRARIAYERVVAAAPGFAPALAGLGTVHLRFARNGFGGVDHLCTADRLLNRALELDPALVEAKLYGASTRIWAGAKDRARLDLQDLLLTEPPDADIYLAAAVVLQLDGLLDDAFRLQGMALRVNPAVAPRAYYYRARILLFQGRSDLSRLEIDKGLAVEPQHTLLRHVLGFLQLQDGRTDEGIRTLESVLEAAPTLRIIHPTLAGVYRRVGRHDDADRLIDDALRDAARADAETAYRLAMYHAELPDRSGAMAWLRRSIELGNENAPWLTRNPAFTGLAEDPEFQRIRADLEAARQVNAIRWRPVLQALGRTEAG